MSRVFSYMYVNRKKVETLTGECPVHVQVTALIM